MQQFFSLAQLLARDAHKMRIRGRLFLKDPAALVKYFSQHAENTAATPYALITGGVRSRLNFDSNHKTLINTIQRPAALEFDGHTTCGAFFRFYKVLQHAAPDLGNGSELFVHRVEAYTPKHKLVFRLVRGVWEVYICANIYRRIQLDGFLGPLLSDEVVDDLGTWGNDGLAWQLPEQ